MSRYGVAILGIFFIFLTQQHDGRVAADNVKHERNAKAQIHPNAIQHLQTNSILLGLTQVASKELVSETCYDQLKQTRDDFFQKKVWALKMLDSSGSHEPGFMFGNGLWIGDVELCDGLKQNASIHVNKDLPNIGILTEKAPFDVRFYVVFLEHNSTWQVYLEFALSNPYLHVGLCMPRSCAAQELQSLMINYMSSDYFASVYGDVYDIHGKVAYIKDLELSDKFYQSTALHLLKWILSFTVVMILLALLVRLLERDTNEGAAGGEENVLKDFVKCFDVKDNMKKLFALNVGKNNEFALIDGMRSIAAIAVVVFHTMYLPESTFTNKVFHYMFAENMSVAVIFVDNFFVISSFLGAFNFLRNRQLCEQIKQNNLQQNIKEFLLQILHRLLRVVPAYFVMLVSMDVLYLYLEDTSVFHIMERYHMGCSKYWWHNAMFIQNFYDPEEMCALWTWSLAIEMQYFLYVLILLFVYVKNPTFVKIMIPSLITVNIVWTAYTAEQVGCASNLSLISSYFAILYSNPSLRILPYLIGTMAGWYAIEVQPHYKIPRFIHHLLWPAALSVYLLGCFGAMISVKIIWCQATAAIFGRLAFALSVCWMILASRNGQGGWWSRIFEFDIYQYVTKVSYGTYMWHGLVINAFFGLTATSVRFERVSYYIWNMGIYALSYIIGVVSCLAFELPYGNLSNLIKKQNKTKIK